MKYGIATIGQPYNKRHIVFESGNPVCTSPRSLNRQLFGDEWGMTLKQALLKISHDAPFACRRCLVTGESIRRAQN